MKPLILVMATLHLAWGAAITSICPDSCTCQFAENVEATCHSYEFIKKLTPKQGSTIATLTMNNNSSLVDSKLKNLKNLQTLNLSGNHIATLPSKFPYLPKLTSLNLTRNYLKEIALSELPKNLQTLDLSHNSLVHFPKDWKNLKQLKTLNMYNNPIDCDCDNLYIYEQLVKNVEIPEDLTCHSPKEFLGRSLKSINCSMIRENLLNSMLGDEAGSGEVEPISLTSDNIPIVDDQEQFLAADETTESHDVDQVEGSGDFEGSGAIIPIEEIPPPPACHVDCSTAKPVGADDEPNASPPPSFKEQVRIFFNDLAPNGETTLPPIPPTQPKQEEPFIKEIDKNSEVETFPTNDTVVGEMERASLVDSNAQTVYIVVGLLVAFAAFVIIYYVNKRRGAGNSRRRNKSNENGFGEEMKPLEKTVIQEKITKPEAAPLLNGQNGKISDDGLKTDQVNGKSPENAEIRKQPANQELLTPQLERVTIKSGEIPDSVPKTPMLVHRQLNNDGEIVTTVVSK